MTNPKALERIQQCLETQATELNLSNLGLTELPKELAKCTQLTKLYLGDNQLTDIILLAGLTQINWLDLGNNQLTDITPLANLTQLTWLYIRKNQLTNVDSLSKLTNCTIVK